MVRMRLRAIIDNHNRHEHQPLHLRRHGRRQAPLVGCRSPLPIMSNQRARLSLAGTRRAPPMAQPVRVEMVCLVVHQHLHINQMSSISVHHWVKAKAMVVLRCRDQLLIHGHQVGGRRALALNVLSTITRVSACPGRTPGLGRPTNGLLELEPNTNLLILDSGRWTQRRYPKN